MSKTISPIFYKKIKFTSEDNQNIQVFYDKHVKKLIIFKSKEFLIYDKRGEKLKRKISYSLTLAIQSVSLDKLLRYALFQTQSNTLTLLNLDKLSSQQISFDSKILNTFFINVNCCPNPSHNEIVRFSLVTESKMMIYRVNTNDKDKLTELCKVKLSNPKSCYYNPTFITLVLEKPDFIYDFYNLANEKFYTKPFEYTYPLKKTRKSSFHSFFSFSKKDTKNSDKTPKSLRKNIYYKQTQYFLEKLYKKLFFLVLNFEEGELQIHHVSHLNTIKRIKSIPFDNTKTTSLQIIDNLIFIHYFDKMESAYYDTKSDYLSDKVNLSSIEVYEHNRKQEIITAWTEFDEDDEKNDNVKLVINYNIAEIIPMKSRENKSFYNLELEGNGQFLRDRLYNDYYFIYFNPEIYYETSDIKSEGINFLMRRKFSKDSICSGIYDLIKDRYNFKLIIKLFEKIAKRINKRKALKTLDKEKVCVNYQLISGPNDLINPIYYLSLNIGNEVTQSMIYDNVFKSLVFRNDSDMAYLTKTLLQYKNALIQYNNPLEQGFFDLLINCLKKLYNINLIYVYFQYRAVPDNIEVAKYLLESAIENKKIVNSTYFHYAMDILTRLKRTDEIFKIFLDIDMDDEGLRYLRKLKNIEPILQSTIFEKVRYCSNSKEILYDLRNIKSK